MILYRLARMSRTDATPSYNVTVTEVDFIGKGFGAVVTDVYGGR